MEGFSTQIFSNFETTEIVENTADLMWRLNKTIFQERNFFAGIYALFKPIPTWQHVCAIWLLLVTGWVTNSIIIKIYWRLKSNNRIYVLTMAFMDMNALTFVLLPRFAVLFLGNGLLRSVIELARHSTAILIFTLYMLLPLFLALDRFVAVSYPHKMKDNLERLRPLKIGCVIHSIVQVVVAVAIEVSQGTESVWFRLVTSCVLLGVSVEVVSALTLYVIIVVKVTASRNEMKKHRSTNTQDRY